MKNAKEKLVEKLQEIVEDRFDEILQGTIDAIVEGYGDGVATINPDGEISFHTLSTNTRLHPESEEIEIYRIEENIIANSPWDINDILSDEEWENLREKFGNEADYMDEAQLHSIGIDLTERIHEALFFYGKENRDKIEESAKDNIRIAMGELE